MFWSRNRSTHPAIPQCDARGPDQRHHGSHVAPTCATRVAPDSEHPFSIGCPPNSPLLDPHVYCIFDTEIDISSGRAVASYPR